MSNLHKKLKDNMILFGKVVMGNMFSVASPDFHYEISEVLELTSPPSNFPPLIFREAEKVFKGI